MKVELVIGPYQGGKCGVGDYSFRLAAALNRAGAVVDLMSEGDWRLKAAPSLLRRMRRADQDVVHIQYPTVGFGRMLGPQSLALSLRSVVTVHEASRSHLLRKVSLYPFSFRTRHVIFTSEAERRFALRWAPWIATRSSVIPIGSNIEARPPVPNRSTNKIVYFGRIMPRKGIEDVLLLAELLKTECPLFEVCIVGSCRSEHSAYAARLRKESRNLPVTWEEDADDSIVAQRLAESWIAYLPFPDGASERRGSLKAALASGMAVVTTRGRDTPENLATSVRFCSTPAEALAMIRELAGKPDLLNALGKSARRHAASFAWEMIASQHLGVYESVRAATIGRNGKVIP